MQLTFKKYNLKVGNTEGWTCKVVCNARPNRPSLPARPTTTTSPTTSTTTSTTTTTTTTTTEESFPSLNPRCQCGVAPASLEAKWFAKESGRRNRAINFDSAAQKTTTTSRIVCPPGMNCEAGPTPWQVNYKTNGSISQSD